MSRREGWVFGLTFVGVMALAAVLSLLFQTVAVRLGVQQAWPLLRGDGKEAAMKTTGWVIEPPYAVNTASGVVFEVNANMVYVYHLSRAGEDAHVAFQCENEEQAVERWQSMLRQAGAVLP